MLNIIYILNGKWETDHRRPQMEAMAALSNLICIESPISLYTFVKYPIQCLKWIKSESKVRRLSDSLIIFRPIALVPYSIAEAWRFFGIINILIFKWFIKRKIKRHIKQPLILMLSHPMQRFYIGLFDEKFLCYEVTDAYDKITFFDERKNLRTQHAEEKVLSAADIVFASASSLKEEKERHNKNIYFMPNAVDVKLFSKSLDPTLRVPEDLERIASPRVGLIGHLTVNVDLELIQTMAGKHPEWSIVIIGAVKENSQFKKRDLLKKLNSYRNIHLLGSRPYELLPLYQKGIEVCLLPYKLNRYNRYVYPNKLHQHLAGGRPVVSTDLPEVRPFAHVVSIAKSKEEFIDLVDRALKSKDATERIQERLRVAGENSVATRARQRAELLTALMSDEAIGC